MLSSPRAFRSSTSERTNGSASVMSPCRAHPDRPWRRSPPDGSHCGPVSAFAWLHETLSCPKCGTAVTDLVWFHWGGVLSSDINCGPVYVRGDRLLWFADATGRVHADVSIPMSRGANIGDPSMTHVDVYDVNGVPSRCPGCDLRMYGSKVEIRDGVIWGAEVLLYEPPSDLHAVVWDPVTGKESQRLSAFKPLGVLPWPS
jgi:hypothetical protein